MLQARSHICVCVRVCVHVHAYVCAGINTHCVGIPVCVSLYVCVHMNLWVCACACMRARVYFLFSKGVFYIKCRHFDPYSMFGWYNLNGWVGIKTKAACTRKGKKIKGGKGVLQTTCTYPRHYRTGQRGHSHNGCTYLCYWRGRKGRKHHHHQEMPWPPLDCTWYYRENRHLASTAQQFTLNASHQNKHWQELTQGSLLSRQFFLSQPTRVRCGKLVFVTTRRIFCHNKSMLAVTSFVMTKRIFCHNKSMLAVTSFVMTKLCLLWQNIFFCDKTFFFFFFATSILLSWQKMWFVVTTWQTYFCHDKRCVLSWQTCFCHDKHVFVVTKLLLQQKWPLWQLPPMTQNKQSTDHAQPGVNQTTT